MCLFHFLLVGHLAGDHFNAFMSCKRKWVLKDDYVGGHVDIDAHINHAYSTYVTKGKEM